MKHNLSVVIATRNCEDRITATVKPWVDLAAEVIVVDQNSTDKTVSQAKQMGCEVIVNTPPQGNFDYNRKVGILKAKSEWILYIDTDERPTQELLAELNEFFTKTASDLKVSGVKIPNYFYFLGHQLRHGLYNPNSAEIRLFRRNRWHYPCENGFHHGVSVEGKVITFKNGYKHFNVNALSEWFIKTNQYTEFDANLKSGNLSVKNIKTYKIFFEGFSFFIKHYFFKLGFLDGFPGLVSVFYFMLYHMTLKIKIWEKIEQKKLKEEFDFIKPIEIQHR